MIAVRRRLLRCAVVLGVCAQALVPGVAAAAEQPPRISIAVSPARLALGPDEIGTPSEFTVLNRGDHPVRVSIDKRDLSPVPDGSLRFPPHSPFSAREWVAVSPSEIEIDPGQRRTVTVEVSLPEPHVPGDHHVALLFIGHAERGTGNIRANSGVGVPIYVRAPGPVRESLELTGFRAPGFAVTGPIRFTASLRNTGTVHRDFREDDALVLDAAGRSVEFPGFAVLRDASRVVTAEWRDPPLFCVCQVRLAVPVPDGEPLVGSATVIIVPLHLLLPGLVLVLAGAFGWWWSRRVPRRSGLHYRPRGSSPHQRPASTGDPVPGRGRI